MSTKKLAMSLKPQNHHILAIRTDKYQQQVLQCLGDNALAYRDLQARQQDGLGHHVPNL